VADLSKHMNLEEYQPQWSTWGRRVAIVGLLIAVIYTLTLLAPVMSLLAITFLLSLVMVGPCRLLTQHLRLPYSVAVVLCYGVVILLLGILLALLVPASLDAVSNLSREAQQWYSQLQDTLRRFTPDQAVVSVAGIRVDLHSLIDPVRDLVLGIDQNTAQAATVISPSDLSQWVPTMTGLLASAIAGLGNLVSTSLLAYFLSFLVLLDLPTLERTLPDWIDPAYQREWGLLVQQIGSVWHSFLRGQVLIAFIVAVATWLQLTLMGVQNSVLVAVFCGVISLIPTIGGIIALVPVAAIALIQESTVFTDMSAGTFAVTVVMVNLVITQIIWNVVAPKIMGNAVNLPLPIIIVGIFIGVALGGIEGAFLITPLIGTVRVILHYLLGKIGQQDPFPGQELRGSLGGEVNN
jgi:predicted PurR-regulated permease PerM